MRTRLARLLLRLSRRLDPAPYGYARGGLITSDMLMTRTVGVSPPVHYYWRP